MLGASSHESQIYIYRKIYIYSGMNQLAVGWATRPQYSPFIEIKSLIDGLFMFIPHSLMILIHFSLMLNSLFVPCFHGQPPAPKTFFRHFWPLSQRSWLSPTPWRESAARTRRIEPVTPAEKSPSWCPMLEICQPFRSRCGYFMHHLDSYGHLLVVNIYTFIYRMYNPIYNQLYLIAIL